MFSWKSPNGMFEFTATVEAMNYLKNVAEQPFIQVGINKGGCSGMSYSVEEKTGYDDRHYIIPMATELSILVDRDIAENIFKKLECRLVQQSYGDLIVWAHDGAKKVCGCGESFQ
ncbi:MAG: hypothetical protein FJ161_01215 [Gammaproteobacteria bacterium]|nr:hypothetical protein [Gammaproteobacteria bacterium]